MHIRSRSIPPLMIVDEDDAPPLSAKHLCGGQAGRPTPDDCNIEI
jgi:hypothetical protein